MVGVPGRSKGCSTCRRRKKGCDRQRPTCTQCSAIGLECGGYERETVFINHSQHTKANAVAVIYRKQRAELADTARTPRDVDDIALPHDLARSAYIEKYISIFLSRYLGASSSASYPDWIEIAHNRHTSDKAVQLSLLSFGLFAVGQPELALLSYSGALQRLQLALYDGEKAQEESTFATCKLLTLFEIFHGHDPNWLSQGLKWHSHLGGQIAIIKLRSPYEYQRGASHHMFAEAQYALIFSSLKERKRYALNTPEWRTIPWEHEPKAARDKLCDLFADLTDIVADTDHMRYCDDPVMRDILRIKVVEECRNLDQRLRNWLDETGELKDFPAINLAAAYDPDYEPAGPTDPHEFILAQTTMLYWLIYILLFSTLASIHDPSMSYIPEDLDARPFMRRLANALPYLWSRKAGLKGASIAAMPWGMALHVIYAAINLYQEERVLLERFVYRQESGPVLSFLNSLHKTAGTPELAAIDGVEGMILRAKSWMWGKR
ncbi:hypothetical protein GGS20DRAFT_140781 [Poronia punctata]|nr:hypothetical protein GGS20DRAFT_140781 [Poronia punctata]